MNLSLTSLYVTGGIFIDDNSDLTTYIEERKLIRREACWFDDLNIGYDYSIDPEYKYRVLL